MKLNLLAITGILFLAVPLYAADLAAGGKIRTVVQPSPKAGEGLTYSQRQLPDGSWVKTGLMVIFYESGMVESVQTVVDDVLSGMRWDYFPDGSPCTRGCYKNGKPTGVWRIWKRDGSYIEKSFDVDLDQTSGSDKSTLDTQPIKSVK